MNVMTEVFLEELSVETMKLMVLQGTCLDVNEVGSPVEDFEDRVWKLKEYKENFQYCDAEHERWIYSVGKSKINGLYYASIDDFFHMNPYFVCVQLHGKPWKNS